MSAPNERSDYRRWDELDEDDRKVIEERIGAGLLPRTFRVSDHLYYVGRRLEYLSPTPITRPGPR
jgi:hypothetical protein